jgi:hypothetical protein
MTGKERRKSLRVGIPESAVEKLTELADRDFRSPAHEAAALLVEAIERAIHCAPRTAGRGRARTTGDAGVGER